MVFGLLNSSCKYFEIEIVGLFGMVGGIGFFLVADAALDCCLSLGVVGCVLMFYYKDYATTVVSDATYSGLYPITASPGKADLSPRAWTALNCRTKVSQTADGKNGADWDTFDGAKQIFILRI